MGRAPVRHWTRLARSDWVSDGTTVRRDPMSRHRSLDPSDLPRLDFVEHVFLPDAQAKAGSPRSPRRGDAPREAAEHPRLRGLRGLAAAIGLGMTAWGVVTRVRRRAAVGVVVVLVSVVLLVGVPLWGLLLPSWDAASPWILIGVAGLVALVVAGLLDWGRAATRRQLTRLEDANAGWE
jgi:hypothetical protein